MIPFSKYQGCGNTFILIEEKDVVGFSLSLLAKTVCHSHLGVGADGLILVKQPLEMIFYNQDGTRAPMCGNGIRCFAMYCIDKGIVDKANFGVKTLAGKMHVEVEKEQVQIQLGKPSFDIDLLHMDKRVNIKNFMLAGYEMHSVFIGTIHTVIFVEDLTKVDIEKDGRRICEDSLFREKSNVNFVEVVDSENIRVETYERGVGKSVACGTGCCASFIYAHRFDKVVENIKVHLQYGSLQIGYIDGEITMKGAATLVCEGKINIEEENLC